MKFKIGFLLICILFISSFTPIFAIEPELVSKNVLVYEILSIQVDQNYVTIKGWALMNEVQHFVGEKDHSYEIEFRSPGHNFKVSTELTPLSQTSTMRFDGTSRCGNNDLYKPGRSCYYDFENVGFSAKVELSKFKMDSIYTTYLISHSKTAGFSGKIPLYYPIKEDIVKQNQEFEYRVVSKLDDTQLKVNVTTLQARKAPFKSAAIWYAGPNCAGGYKNRLYFLENTTYYGINSKTIDNNSSYYSLNAQSAGCINGRGRIKEGSSISPVWIASNFVDYGGTPLQIKTKIINTAPIITILNHPIIEIGSKIDPLIYVSAWDLEEGNLTSKIQLITSNLDISKIGQYTLKYEVFDKYGLSDTKDLTITIIGPKNKPPIIYAEDKVIKQFQKFDPLDQVTAYDPEDGNVTKKLKVLNTIDTSLVLDQQLCYYVEDSKLASHTKCIQVKVIEDLYRNAKIRFVDWKYLFYNEDIPVSWIGLLNKLEIELDNQIPYLETTLIK